ncbi:MAG TPA: serine hydrolase domain-containing protein [Candidatus Binataceae bacterium]|nr:serine hydrolase domain-containing protein [Candidatus Binataceae bacterium]
MTDVTIEGSCDARFARVREAFAANFVNYRETGASVSLVLDGRVVADLWGGWADKARTRPWRRDTIVNTYSTTKGLTAICAHRLAGEGRLDLDAPVAEYWPEFAANGKSRIPVRQLMNHRAGLPAIRRPLKLEDLYDWRTMTGALAAEEPWWEPGTRHGYHALTFGYLVGEVIRRVAGRSVGNYFRDEIAAPVGLDAHIGLDAREDDRVAEMIGAPPPAPGEFNLFAEMAKNPDSVTARTFANPPVLSMATVNSRGWRGAEIPAANGHTNARALARLYGALARGGEVDSVRVMAAPAIPALSVEESFGPDAVLLISTRFSPGFMLSQPGEEMGPNARAFGHPGAGGSLGFADPEAKIGFGYAMNRMGAGILLDPRAKALIAAAYASL